jgi:hypothetical protein
MRTFGRKTAKIKAKNMQKQVFVLLSIRGTALPEVFRKIKISQ